MYQLDVVTKWRIRLDLVFKGVVKNQIYGVACIDQKFDLGINTLFMTFADLYYRNSHFYRFLKISGLFGKTNLQK